MPDGGEFTLPAVPLLVSHDFSRPIGHVIAAKASPSALWFRARVANWGPFRGLHEEWLRLQDGTYAAVSPGVRSLGGGVGTAREFTRWQWNELSVARVGANPHALINLVHELDRPHVVHLPGRGETIYRDLRPKVTTPQYRPAVAIGG